MKLFRLRIPQKTDVESNFEGFSSFSVSVVGETGECATFGLAGVWPIAFYNCVHLIMQRICLKAGIINRLTTYYIHFLYQ